MLIMMGIAAGLRAQGKEADARSTFMVALIVGAVGAANVVYDFDAWSVPKKIGIHFLLMLVTVYPVLLFSGWFPMEGTADALKVFGYFCATGVGILAFLGLVFVLVGRLRRGRDGSGRS